jgi:hypothetical protein
MAATLSPAQGRAWLDRRDHHDLDPRAERALRAAGVAFEDDAEAEANLATARALAPRHRAVLIAHYRYHFYKHRFAEAEPHARACVALGAQEASLAADFRLVAPSDRDFAALDPATRFWLFALQAHAYVLLRLGRREEAFQAFRKIIELDARDQTKTRVLLEVLENPEREEG